PVSPAGHRGADDSPLARAGRGYSRARSELLTALCPGLWGAPEAATGRRRSVVAAVYVAGECAGTQSRDGAGGAVARRGGGGRLRARAVGATPVHGRERGGACGPNRGDGARPAIGSGADPAGFGANERQGRPGGALVGDQSGCLAVAYA